MLHAAIRQSPVFGGRLKGYDEAVIHGRKGVHRVVPLPPDAIAVVADTYWQAQQALHALPVTWDDGPRASVNSASIRELLREGLTATDAAVVRRDGDVDTALAAQHRRSKPTTTPPIWPMRRMEPQNCTAHVTAERVEIWVPSQNGEAALAAAAAAAGVIRAASWCIKPCSVAVSGAVGPRRILCGKPCALPRPSADPSNSSGLARRIWRTIFTALWPWRNLPRGLMRMAGRWHGAPALRDIPLLRRCCRNA